MRGYKVFDHDWKCRNYQYKVGETFEEDVTPKCCERGFHFCVGLKKCFNYYPFDPVNKVAEIEALGEIDINADEDKYCTNKIKIVREITWEGVLRLVNKGVGCTGLGNIGDYNSGWNNVGNYNTGDCNSGSWNSGQDNAGNINTGNKNSGTRNSGDGNIGNQNTGRCNIGNLNTGDRNKGNYNSGYNNSGNQNTGDHNIGNCNVGDWNKGSYSNGCFNTIQEPTIMMFNKPSNWRLKDWRYSTACQLLDRIILAEGVVWIPDNSMTEEAKEQHPEYKTTGGYLKECTGTNRGQIWWDSLTREEKQIIFDLPNFDPDIFEEIIGVRV